MKKIIEEKKEVTIMHKKAMIDKARRDYVDRRLGTDGLELALTLSDKKNKKGNDVFNWYLSILKEANKRKSEVTFESDNTVNDFTMFDLPHSLDVLRNKGDA